LTYAAETYGKRGGPSAIKLLYSLVQHESPLVREGAWSGLEHALEQLFHSLHWIARHDASKGAQAAAAEVLLTLGINDPGKP
jgi:hypothetical protein